MTTTEPTFRATVRGLSSEGLGVLNHPDGRVFFAQGTWPGDEGVFEVERFERRFGYARLASLEKASADRREKVPCPYQGWERGKCGGCSWMIGTYESQLKHKEERLRHALSRAKLVDDENDERIQPVIGSVDEFGYRNRAQFKSDGERLGFVSANSREIADVDACLVLSPAMGELYASMRAKLPNSEWRPAEGDKWSMIDVDDTMKPIQITAKKRRPFRQGNTAQNARMKTWIAEKLKTANSFLPVIELYCGSGNLTEVLVERGFLKIIAVETNLAATKQLAARNFPNVSIVAGDLRHPASWKDLEVRVQKAGTMLLDPPREGAAGVAELAKNMPKLHRIIYVSCDISTFTRDAAELVKAGFKLNEVQSIDLFPQTPHLEILSEFVRT